MPVYINGKEQLFVQEKPSFLNRHYRLKNFLFEVGIKLKLIRRAQWFMIEVYDENGKVIKRAKTYNSIVNVGAQALGNLMIAGSTNTLNNVNVGTSNAATTNTMTDLQSPASGSGRQAATTRSVSASAPYFITIASFIGSGIYTRPVTIQEIAVFFDPTAGGVMFARSVISSTVLNVGNTATLSYGVLLQ